MITDINDLPFSRDILDTLRDMGITSLYPPQSEAIDHVLTGKNLVMSVPTASGKSLVAYLAILGGLARGGKGLYIVPLRALASEKFEDLKGILPIGYKVAMSIGDFDEADQGLMRNDVIVATSEKADSLFRHRPDFLKQFSVVIADEVHLMTDPGRGHILEVLLTRLLQLGENIQIIALSATIPNSKEIADWLGAEHMRSDWRPVDLREGVFHDGVLTLQVERPRSGEGSSPAVPITSNRTLGSGDPMRILVLDGIEAGGQCLVFVNTRKSCEVAARKLVPSVRSRLDEKTIVTLSDVASRLSSTQDEPTDMVTRLSACVEGGCGFHHAGLGNNQRKIIEQGFKKGLIKVLVATPTLAAGINLPARRVIIRDTTRFGGRHAGTQPIANLELKQMAGRAGRPGYDPYGEAIFIARRPEDAERILNDVINGETERIESKLGVAPILRIHIISSIASGYVTHHRELMEFLGSTFYACQFELRESEVRKAIGFLERNEMIVVPQGRQNVPGPTSDFVSAADLRNQTKGISADSGSDHGDELRVTSFGKLVSDLYIDPKSAVVIRKALERSGDRAETPLSYLHAICATPDMLTLYARESEMEEMLMMAELYRDELLLSPMDREVYGESQALAHEIYAEEIKTAILLKRWIDESDENTITGTFNIGPGDLRNKVDTARWLLHALDRIASLFHYDTRIIRDLVKRVTYGVKEELLPLVELRGVGRVKARALFKGGFRDVTMLRNAEIDRLIAVPGIGKSTIFMLMDQLGRDMSDYEQNEGEDDNTSGEGIVKLQRSLFDFNGDG
jgi:helicase